MKHAWRYRIFYVITLVIVALVSFWLCYSWMEKGTSKIKVQEPKLVKVKQKEKNRDEKKEDVKVINQAIFILKEQSGYVVILNASSRELYDETGIKVSELPRTIGEKIKEGLEIYSYGELYDFLENYSS